MVEMAILQVHPNCLLLPLFSCDRSPPPHTLKIKFYIKYQNQGFQEIDDARSIGEPSGSSPESGDHEMGLETFWSKIGSFRLRSSVGKVLMDVTIDYDNGGPNPKHDPGRKSRGGGGTFGGGKKPYNQDQLLL